MREQLRGFESDIEHALDRVYTACETFPYKFREVPSPFKRACVRKIEDAEQALAKFRRDFELKHLVRTAEDNLVVEMEILDNCFITPTVEELRAAFKSAERVFVEHPAPDPQDLYREENPFPNKAWNQLYVTFKTSEEAAKAIQMGPLTVRVRDTLLSVRFRAALSKEERVDWTKIRMLMDRLKVVQKTLTEMRAVETNDPHPFSVELSPLLVIAATSEYLDQLKTARERFDAGDGSRLSLLDKRPRPEFEDDQRKVQRLNKERVELIFELREFQAEGYDFSFDMNI